MRQINKNYAALVYALRNGYRGAVLEGGSRSGKTWSALLFEMWLTSQYENLVINNIRETYNSFKTTIFDDYHALLTVAGIYSPFINKDVTTFRLFGNKINFVGADKVSKFHGMGSDFFYMNEVLEGIGKAFFDHMEQRCKRFWWMDYNPSASDHWVFDLEKRPDVLFVRSTILDNPHVSEAEKKKILSYEPTPDNISLGTADDYMWKVYGLGLRASPEGLVYNNVKYVSEFPNDCEEIAYGIDFGQTNQTAIIRAGVKLKESVNGIFKHDLFLQKLFYLPTPDVNDVISAVKALGIEKHVWCDNNQPGWIADMRQSGIVALPTKKFDGSREYWITTLKRFNIHIVRDLDFKKEQENFKYRVIDGIQLSETVKKFDHLWSASGYAVVGDFRQYFSE